MVTPHWMNTGPEPPPMIPPQLGPSQQSSPSPWSTSNRPASQPQPQQQHVRTTAPHQGSQQLQPQVAQRPQDPWADHDPWQSSTVGAEARPQMQPRGAPPSAPAAPPAAAPAAVPPAAVAQRAPAAAPAQEATRGRYFHVDLCREASEKLGVQVKWTPLGIQILAVSRNSQIDSWNERCHSTFPEDAVREGDIICRVNGAGPEDGSGEAEKRMMERLGMDTSLFLVIYRATQAIPSSALLL